MTHCFQVGGKYRNRKGEYEVISINDTNMVIRYSDGSILESPIVDQDRIWRNIQREELRDRLPKPKPKQRGASPGLGRKARPAGIAAKDADLAVFTRNHGHYLREAAEVCAQDKSRKIFFRARSKWSSADRYIAERGPTEIYMSPVGGNGIVEYVATLCEVMLDPSKTQPRVQELLSLSLESTKEEGLWDQYGKPVKTLYVISDCRKLATPFPMTDLVKINDNKPIEDNFGYSYCLVHRHSFASPS